MVKGEDSPELAEHTRDISHKASKKIHKGEGPPAKNGAYRLRGRGRDSPPQLPAALKSPPKASTRRSAITPLPPAQPKKSRSEVPAPEDDLFDGDVFAFHV